MNNPRQIFEFLKADKEVLILFFSLLPPLSVLQEWDNALRPVLVFCFLLFCPALLFSHFIPVKDLFTRFFLIAALSIAANALIAQAFLYAQNWQPLLILFTVTGVCWAGAFLRFLLMPASQKTQSLHFFLSSLRRGWAFPLLFLLIGMNGSFVYSFYYAQPKYQAFGKFLVALKPQYQGEENLPDAGETLSKYADILGSYQVKSQTLELLLQNPDDFEQYQNFAVANPEENTITLQLTGPNPETAAALLNSIGQHGMDVIRGFYPFYDIEFIERAAIPKDYYFPQPYHEAALAALAGLLFGVWLALLWRRVKMRAV